MKFLIDGTYPVKPDVATYAQFTRVKLDTTASQDDLNAVPVTAAGIEDDFGVLMDTDPYQTAGNRQTVRLANAPGSVPMIASGAITFLAQVYPDASGKITATPQGRPIGIALQAASGNNSVIEIARSLAPVVHITKNLTSASVSEYLFTADRAMKIVLANLLVAVAGAGGAATVAIRKITKAGTALPGDAAGATVIELLSATMDLTSAAGTPVVGALSAIAGALNLAIGDKVAIKLTGTLTSLVALLDIQGQPL